MRALLFLAAFAAATGCGGSSGGDDSSERDGDNPVVQIQFFGENGNLYKPNSDEKGAGQGNLVVLFGPQFTTQFESCSIQKTDGTAGPLICINNQPWTQIPFSCFSNGNRQTWRASFSCSDVTEVKVTCKDFNQEIVFTVPDGQKSSVCTRFG